MLSNFNDILMDRLFVGIDEAKAEQRPSAKEMAVMQDLITGREMNLHRKFKDAEQRSSYADFMLASNSSDSSIAQMNQGSRRYVFLECNNDLSLRHSDDPAKIKYFQTLNHIVESREGQLAIAHYYDNVCLDNFEPWNSATHPKTTLMLEQNDKSMSSQQSFWRCCIERGYIYREFPSGCH